MPKTDRQIDRQTEQPETYLIQVQKNHTHTYRLLYNSLFYPESKHHKKKKKEKEACFARVTCQKSSMSPMKWSSPRSLDFLRV